MKNSKIWRKEVCSFENTVNGFDKCGVSEKNYFDQQQQQQAEVAEEAEEEAEIPTVPADPRSTDERCYVCRLVSPH